MKQTRFSYWMTLDPSPKKTVCWEENKQDSRLMQIKMIWLKHFPKKKKKTHLELKALSSFQRVTKSVIHLPQFNLLSLDVRWSSLTQENG